MSKPYEAVVVTATVLALGIYYSPYLNLNLNPWNRSDTVFTQALTNMLSADCSLYLSLIYTPIANSFVICTGQVVLLRQ